MRIIQNSKIKTKSGVFICVGKWFSKGEPFQYDFIRHYDEPITTELIKIDAQTIDKKLSNGEIEII